MCIEARFSLAALQPRQNLSGRGQWDLAREDINTALEELGRKAEATRVRLELAYLYQQLGDFARARREYDLVTKTDSSGIYVRAPV